METLIDMTVLPGPNDYAEWAYRGSGVEGYWADFAEFLQDYWTTRSLITSRLPLYKEFALGAVFTGMAQGREPENYAYIAHCLDKGFWENYLSRCYVSPEVRETVAGLARRYKLGIVSNFKVPGGIETLIRNFGLNPYFEFIVTSINVGWRKPHRRIYDEAIKRSGVEPEQIVFVGDNYECDCLGPGKAGLRAILLDKNNHFPLLPNRITHVKELMEEKGRQLINPVF